MATYLFTFLGSIAAGLAASSIGTRLFGLTEPAQARVWVFTSLTLALCIALLRVARETPPMNKPARGRDHTLNKCLTLILGWLLVALSADLTARLGSSGAATFLSDFIFILPLLPLLTLCYVRLEGRLCDQKEDASASFGAFLRGKGTWHPSAHKLLLLTWLLKAFFVPLMYGNLVLATQSFLILGIVPTYHNWVSWCVVLGLNIDLLVATIGYLSAGKLLRNDVISMDATLLGWAACLICYAPFFQYVSLVISQTDTLIWSDWLDPSQPLYWLWAGTLVAAWTVHWLSFIAFGFRFSNLTYRGLIDRGPYRFCKHPSYVSKNLYWWMHTIPFLSTGSASDTAINIASMSTISFIYYVRAKTEERHLLRFPEYATYAERIKQRSIRHRLRIHLTIAKTS